MWVFFFWTGLFDDVKQLQACLNISCRHGHRDLVEYWIERMKDIVGTTLSDFEFDPKYDLLKAARTGMYNREDAYSRTAFFIRHTAYGIIPYIRYCRVCTAQ